MNANDFRRIALGMDGAIEAAHMGHPDFRVNGKIFATLDHEGTRGMVKLSPDQQRDAIRAAPDTFEPAAGAWGRQGCTMVVLRKADQETVGEAMTLAWQAAVSATIAKPSKTERLMKKKNVRRTPSRARRKQR
ncbi:MAG TPA: MmcQ/YjbR family DNA-binding protein [Vicinamibacterales bacterium]|jgi:hypothetical protein